ncbi:MAG: response regulator [Solidesulfovibrio sp. DCME]|uniref:response regulator n=1 Tax=Solidesulfovibrio sp. DCME TaxID=3447380 RepID=UPI003D0B6D99
MTAPHTPPTLFRSPLIVTASDGHARIDREFFKRARIFGTHHADSGARALEMARKGEVDLIVCDASLADMDARSFVAAVKADPALAHIPVILTMVDARRADVLSAVKLGAAGICLRPYSEDTFRKHLTMAAHMARFAAAEKAALARAAAKEAAGDPEAARDAYEAVTRLPDDAPRYFEEGMAALAARDMERAILAFHKALAVNTLFVEAYLGLARAWKAKGSTRQYRHYMKEAASACARASRFVELRDQFLTLLGEDEAGYNPFLALGNELVRERHYTAAVMLYRHALELAPKNADIYLGLSRAYHFLRRPDLARRAAGKSLALNNRNEEARALQRRLAAGRRPDDIVPMEEAAGQAPPARYPLLLRGVLYLAGLAAETLVRPKKVARAA